MLSPAWRNRLVAAAAVLVAVLIGSDIANGALLLPTTCAGTLVALTVVRLQKVSFAALLLGLAIFGYVVGNRGFAQLSLARNVPLLPAEFVLLVAGALLLLRSAQEHRLPLQRDWLNIAILVWIVVSSVRVFFDVRTFGVMALRDYAMIYYAGFFFLGQEAARDPAGRRFLWRSLAAATVVLAILYPLFARFPDEVMNAIRIRSVPLFFLKADLAGTFMAVGAVMFFLAFEERHWKWALGVSLLLIGSTIVTNNRASMLGLMVASATLALAGRWRFIATQAVAGAVAAIVILFAAYVGNRSWHDTPLGGLYERVVSLGDPLGRRTYSAEDAADKGDNNRFRAVWWRAVFDEAVEGGPWVGLGFGHDLAARFVREYYPDAADDFSVRSPHNVLLTIFARTGLVGFMPFAVIVGVLFVRMVREARAAVSEKTAFWCCASVILVSACFGVVLEGPMGAVVFWTVLGVASGAPGGEQATASAEAAEVVASKSVELVPAKPHPGHA